MLFLFVISFASATVTLNSPADNEKQFSQDVQYNYSTTASGGAYLVNSTLYDNFSGSWQAKQTESLTTSYKLWNYYTLDGNYLDSKGNVNMNVPASSPSLITDCVIGTCYNFSSDYLRNTTDATINQLNMTNVTISAWVKPDTLTTGSNSGNVIVSMMGAGDVGIYFGNDQDGDDGIKMQIYRDGGSTIEAVFGEGALSLGQWSHVVGIVDQSGNVSIYLNGVLRDTVEWSGSTNNQAFTNFYIGADIRFGPRRYWDGGIDEVAIYNRSLTLQEIVELNNSGDGKRPYIDYSTFNETYSGEWTINWNVESCDSDSVCEFASQNRTIFSDSDPPTISVESPNGTLSYNYAGGNETLNVTFTDSNLDSCWYNYNGTNITIDGCQSGVKNSTLSIPVIINIRLSDVITKS